MELLRHVNHRLKLTQKLRMQVGSMIGDVHSEQQQRQVAGGGDWALAAKLITEIEDVGVCVCVNFFRTFFWNPNAGAVLTRV